MSVDIDIRSMISRTNIEKSSIIVYWISDRHCCLITADSPVVLESLIRVHVPGMRQRYFFIHFIFPVILRCRKRIRTQDKVPVDTVCVLKISYR